MNRARILMSGLAAAAACAWWPAASPLAGQALPAVQPRPIVIIGGMLIDGTGAPARRNDAIVIRDGRIKAMGLSAGRKAPQDARLIDGTGKWILPGFIDGAVHLFRSGNLDAPSEPPLGSPLLTASVLADIRRAPAPYLRAYLCAGITSVMNIGGPPWTFDLRDGRLDDAQSPRIGTTGPALALAGPPGAAVATSEDLLVAGADQAAVMVGRLLPSKPDLVAIHLAAASGEAGVNDGLAAAAVIAVHAHHLRAVIAASTAGELRAAVTAGADVVVSRVSDPIDDDVVQRIVGRHVIIIPAMVVGEAQRKLQAGDLSVADLESACAPAASLASLSALHPLNAGVEPGAAGAAARTLEGEQRNVRRLAEAGAMIVAGSGAGEDRVFHGPLLHREFELLAGAGLTPMQIILSATRDAARLFGPQANLGQVKEGVAADLVLLGADPLADIRNAAKVVQTIRGGALYER
jgi:imidazolonepropionase-like amidohydrolase